MKKKLNFLLAFLFCFSSIGWTNSVVDSLQNELSIQKNDTLKISTLLSLADALIFEDTDRAFGFLDSALDLSLNLGNDKYIGFSHKQLGLHYFASSQYKLAMENLLLSEAYFKKIDAKRELCNIYNWMGRVYIQTGYEYEALSKFETAVDLFQELGDTVTVKAIYLNIGAAYHELEYFDLAEKYYLESMEGDENSNAFAYNNLGEVALGREHYLTAKEYFEKSISLQEANGNIQYLSLDYANLGLTFTYLEDYDSAKIYFDKSLLIGKDFKDNYAQLNTNYCLTVYHNAQEQFETSIAIAEDGLRTADSLGILMSQKRFYQSLSDAYAGIGEYALAYEYKLGAETILDSMSNGRDEYGLLHFESEFNVDARITELEKEKAAGFGAEKKFWERDWFLIVVFFLLLIILVIGLEFRRKDAGKANRKNDNIDYLQSTRILYLLGAILYTLLFYVVPVSTDNLIDSIEVRIIISIIILAAYLSTFMFSWVRTNVSSITLLIFIGMVTHHFYLIYINDIALEEFLFLITIMAATVIAIRDFWPMFIFTGCVIAASLFISFTATNPHVDGNLFLGIMTSISLVSLVVTLTKRDINKYLEFSNEAVSSAEAIVFIVNRRGENIYTSPSIKNILGLDPEDMRQHDWIERLGVTRDRASQIKNNLILIAIGTIEPRVNEYQMLTSKTGDEKWLSFKETRMDQNRVLVMGIDVTEQKRIEDELIKSERNLRQINETLSDVFYLYNIEESRYEYISPKCNVLLGAPPEFFYSGKGHTDTYVLEEDVAMVKEAEQSIRRGESYNIVYRLKSDNGIRWIREKSDPVLNENGKVIKNTGLCQDITEQHLAEAEIAKLSLIASNTDNFILMVNKENRVEWANASFYKITGYKEEETIGELPLALISGPQTDESTIDAISDAIFADKKQLQCEMVTYTRSKEIFHSNVEVTPLLDDEGELEKYFVIGSDITQRVSDREQIEKLSLVASNTSNYIIIAHTETGIEWVNEAFTEKFGYKLEEVQGKFPSEFMHVPDMQPHIVNEINDTVFGKSDKFKGEIIHLTKTGEEVHASVDIMPLIYDGAKIEKYFVLGSDISERIRHEQDMKAANAELSKKEGELHESESNFRELIKSIKEVFWLADAETDEMIFVSDSYSEVFGLSVESLINNAESWRKTIHPDDKERVIAAVEKGYANGTFDEEFRIILDTGVEKWVVSRIFTIENNEGKVTKISGFVEDITDKKEQAIRISKFADQLDVVHAIENTILTSESTADIIYNTLQKTLDKLPVLRASLALFKPEEGTFYSYAKMIDGRDSETDGMAYNLEHFSLYETLKETKTNYLEDLTGKAKKSKTDEILISEGAKLALLSPLMHGDKLIGSLNVCFTETIHEDTEHYTEITNEVAKGLAIALQQSQLKDDLHFSNTALTSSIDYAKMIQQAYIPDDVSVDGFFKDNFVINRPKDIVSGDFFWVGKSGDTKIIAVGDCTGHGVPGAFMTIIGISALNNIVNVRGITDPAEILIELNKTIVSALSSTSDIQLKDGMDIGIFCYDNSTNTANYSGARRPLYKLNKSGIESVPGAKLSIGDVGDTFGVSFETHAVDIAEGDIFYLFSDGVTDQFGGKRNKKFTIKRLLNLIVNGANHSMDQNKSIIENALEEWQGSGEQTDDMVLLSFKIDG
jgi:PAS domain S-box-containing protein